MKYVVKWKVYTQSYDVWTEDTELEWEEDNEEEYDTLEQAQQNADEDKYGWRGTYVEVYINDEYERDYEVE